MSAASAGKRESVLIANRGEIAIRVARSARALGLGTVAVYSDADRESEHLRYCDRAIEIGAAAPSASYLNVERVIAAARETGARYVHPGYGFLSERPHFVEACEKADLVFVGPSAQSMRLMGDKIEARKTVDSLGVPRVPGSAGALKDAAEARKFAGQAGYPVLLKAAAGGGGKGMRRVDEEKDIAAAFEGASREAQSAFGDGSMYVEKLVLKPHHVEIQVFGDGKGGAIHLGERECSIQRRHQKVWEESPSPILERFPKTRAAMYEAAVKIACHVKYAGAGTFEFIVDEEGGFYFLEMNTRLQVEHPVTEWVTGVDLVSWQLQLAMGKFKLPAAAPGKDTVERRGSAIEVRIYAEDPRTFLPAPGKIGTLRWPSGAFVRVDTAFLEPGEVSLHYDPMIAKVSVWAPTRAEALDRMRVALDEVRVEPPVGPGGVALGSLRTNLPFLKRLVRCRDVIVGDTPTDLIPKNPDLTAAAPSEPSEEVAVALAIAQLLVEQGDALAGGSGASSGDGMSVWGRVARQEGVRL